MTSTINCVVADEYRQTLPSVLIPLITELAAVCADEANLTGADAIVVPVLRLLRRCYG